MSINRDELLDEFQNRLEKLTDTAKAEIETTLPETPAARRNGSVRRPPQAVVTEPDGATGSINVLIQQVSGESMAESDRLLGELNKVRDMLQVERDRVMREIAEYAALNQSAMVAMKAISDNLTQYHRTGKFEARRA